MLKQPLLCAALEPDIVLDKPALAQVGTIVGSACSQLFFNQSRSRDLVTEILCEAQGRCQHQNKSTQTSLTGP